MQTSRNPRGVGELRAPGANDRAGAFESTPATPATPASDAPRAGQGESPFPLVREWGAFVTTRATPRGGAVVPPLRGGAFLAPRATPAPAADEGDGGTVRVSLVLPVSLATRLAKVAKASGMPLAEAAPRLLDAAVRAVDGMKQAAAAVAREKEGGAR